ncbi:FixH family protein [Bacillus sp. Marseille-Q3570]|uniref:FixH family protein n=1 Tax=Bacillus sp. Marseille-Q3570 TaxID=2963522 RepID=UPI0021B7A928|nr:FixH family protein [Bacillus sp. Marseille-Q3570]
MKKMNRWIPFLIMTIALTACGDREQHAEHKEKKEVSTEMLEVQLHGPDTLVKSETGHFEAVVIQGDEKVEDAEEVEFEIWLEGAKETSINLEAENEGNGVYSVKHSFEQEGEYIVQSHVTARDMHTMPTKKVIVSNE